MHKTARLPSLKLALTLFGAPALLASCTGCERHAAIVEYRQVGACNGLDTLHGAGPNTVFVVFYVETIDNTKTGQDLSFFRGRIQTNEYEPSDPIATVQYSNALGIPYLKKSINVPNGSKAQVHQFVWFVLGTGDPDGAKEASTINYFLRYDTKEGETGVAMTKLDSGRTNWPYTPTCRDIQFPKAPPSIGSVQSGIQPHVDGH